jgi:hypothetical protein
MTTSFHLTIAEPNATYYVENRRNVKLKGAEIHPLLACLRGTLGRYSQK